MASDLIKHISDASFEAASSRLARELGAMEGTDEKSALAKILEILNAAAVMHNKNKEDAA
jgi:CarD family transcriptional regulator